MDSETEQRLRLQSEPRRSLPILSYMSPVLSVDDDIENTNDLIWMEDRPNVSLSSTSKSSSSPLLDGLRIQQRNTLSFPSLLNLHDQRDQQSSPTLLMTTSNNQIVVMSRQVWEVTGNWIDTIQREIEELEQDGILGHAITRACHELADTIAHWTTQLQQRQRHQQLQHSDDDIDDDDDDGNVRSKAVPIHLVDHNRNFGRNDLFEHSVNSLLLFQIEEVNEYNNKNREIKNPNVIYDFPDFPGDNETTSDKQGTIVHDIDPIPPIIDLLIDMEQALRHIDEDEANDLADAAITVGHLLVAAMQQVHSQLASRSNDIDYQYSTELQESRNITLLNDDDDTDDTKINSATMMKPPLPLSTSATVSPPYKPYISTRKRKRVRCIWPPLQPVAQNIVQYAQVEVLQKQPLYITAPILLTCWPIIVTSTIVGSGLVITDNVLQHLYRNIQEHPIMVTSEISMASFVQTMKLGYLTSKAVAKPTVRIAQKQIQRHAPQIQESVLYHIHHPIETIHSTIHTVSWGCQYVVHRLGHSISEWQQQHQQQTSNSLDDALSVNGPMVDSTTTMLQNMSL